MRLALRLAHVAVLSCGGRLASDNLEGGQKDSGTPPVDASTITTRDSASGSQEASPVDAGIVDSSTDPPFTVAWDAGSCGAMADCVACCQDLHATGNMTYYQDVQACVCSAGPCQTACADEYCATFALIMGDPCDTCILAAVAGGGMCSTSPTYACLADTECAAYLECANGCP
jgi:hypothetical protein